MDDPKRFEPHDIEEALGRIRLYANEHGLSPKAVCDLFSTGIVAAHVLAPDLIAERKAADALAG